MEPVDHPADKHTDVQYAMEGGGYDYGDAHAAPGGGGGGGGSGGADSYSQSLDPPPMSSFGDGGGAPPTAPPAPPMNAEESATLQSFLAGGQDSGEGVVLDWAFLLPIAQAVLLGCAVVLAVSAVGSDAWKVGTVSDGSFATVGLSRLRIQDASGEWATVLLRDACAGAAALPSGTGGGGGGGNRTVRAADAEEAEERGKRKLLAAAAPPYPMPPDDACAYASAGASVVGLAWTSIALFIVLAALNGYVALAGRGACSAVQPAVQPLEAKLGALPPAVREYAPTAGWALGLLFIAVALIVFGSGTPPGLGAGVAVVGVSFGALRLCALLVTCGLGVHAASHVEAWRAVLISGASVTTAKWRALGGDLKTRALVSLLGLCTALHIIMWLRDINWGLTLPLLGVVSVLFSHAQGLLAYCVLTLVALFFELLMLAAEGAQLSHGSVGLEVLDIVLLVLEVVALAGTVYLKILAPAAR